MTDQVSVDLVTASSIFLDRLNSLENVPESESDIQRSWWRYESLWLPIVSSSAITLVPPHDVRLMWALHMLMGKEYVDYCQKKFDKVIDHKLLQEKDKNEARDRTRYMWNEAHQHEPYDLNEDIENTPFSHASIPTQQIQGGLILLKAFSYHVSLPHFKDKVYMTSLYKKYYTFLTSQPSDNGNPKTAGSVSIGVLLLWLVHILHPCSYEKDTQKLPEGGPKFTWDFLTFNLADTSVDEDNVDGSLRLDLFSGCDYRGSSTLGELESLTESDLQDEQNMYKLTFHEICVEDLWTHEPNISIEARRLRDSFVIYDIIFKVKGKSGSVIKSRKREGLVTIDFDKRLHKGIEFHVLSRKGFLCTKKEERRAMLLCSPREQLDTTEERSGEFTVNVPKVSSMDPTIIFKYSYDATPRKPLHFFLDREPYHLGGLPDDLLPYVQHLKSWRQCFPADANDLYIVKHGYICLK